ncbi:S26 family signal peptidase [Actinosynnema sp. NPDC047251]|uniref:signal peptidase I n=1 Tax=Saccharothrix espanaensis (strain ATCC 51144 / DSM 44229 / JCM 9112 / NBRC 15066 / NRRL 15764) TaxID=1179773 RepID=K0JU96_SACES|nr:S26 family signal peptidase [Saccharothrix espanaensis]CCH28384.1 hypothetical protein BN6_10560 [Saccharothrix espanaensis DSM 44229]
MIWAVFGAITAALAVLLWLRSRVVYVKISGRSMEPTFEHGDSVVARRVRTSRLRTGDVVVVDGPRATVDQIGRGLPSRTPIVAREPLSAPPPATGPNWVIKRVAAMPGEPVPQAVAGVVTSGPVVPPGFLVVLGDNSENSIDSRQHGMFPLGKVLAKVVRTVPR